jgi:sugar lactone lactonase YvrE/predicted glycoside hydrolase/deacetylase ChbG (UPF0249 family)/nicotinamidase-related amidase
MMKTLSMILALLMLHSLQLALSFQVRGAEIELTLRTQLPLPKHSTLFQSSESKEKWNPEETAVIVCDVWDYHHSPNAVKRLEEFAPRLNEVLKAARKQGMTIIHAPSDCMDNYQDHPARQRAQTAPTASYRPFDIEDWCSALPSEKGKPYPIDQSDGGADDDSESAKVWSDKLKALGRNPGTPWLAQSSLITIDSEKDFISDRGGEVWNILESRGVKNVILTGVHVNMCVLGRPFGLRQMARNGKRVVLMRDMTDSMYNPKAWPYVSHFTGNDLIINHIERYVCPTISSDQFIPGKPFRFSKDLRKKIDVILSPQMLVAQPWIADLLSRDLPQHFAVQVTPWTRTVTGRFPTPDSQGDCNGYLVFLSPTDLENESLKAFEAYLQNGVSLLSMNGDLVSLAQPPQRKVKLTGTLHELTMNDASVDSLTSEQKKLFFEMLATVTNSQHSDAPSTDKGSAKKPFMDHWTTTRVPSSYHEILGDAEAGSASPGWYRCVVKIPATWLKAGPLALEFLGTREPNSTRCYLNGHELSANPTSSFAIPAECVNANDHNVLVVRVANSSQAIADSVRWVAANNNELLLDGMWQFRIGDSDEWKNMPLPAKFGGGADIVFAPEDPRWTPRSLTRPFEFTPGVEGPGCDRAGNVYAVNYAMQGTIGVSQPDGTATVFTTLPEGSVGNGIRFDAQGNFFVADYTGHNILQVNGITGAVSKFAHEARMSQPNDLAIADDGTLFASDPNWGDSTGRIWRIDTDGNVTLVAEGLGTSNGIEVSPDNKTLYVNESAQRNVWAFTITADKKLVEKRLVKQFEDHGFDGMRVDVDGNLYITRYGKGTVVKMSPQGDILKEIPVLGSRPSNICFGGPDGCTAYVTEVDSCRLVAFRVDRPGREWKPPKQLIIHADDAGMSHSVNQGTIEAMRTGIVTSVSIITPAPWFKEFARFAKHNPQYDYGVHLALNSEWDVYRWGSAAPADKVPSLLDPEGYLWDGVAQVAQHAKADEVEIELRAQIDKAFKFGVPVSHIDTHMGALMSRPDLIDVYVKVAVDYNLPLLFLADHDGSLRKAYPSLAERFEMNIKRIQDRRLPLLDHLVQIYGGDDLKLRKDHYMRDISNLPNGITQLIIHCGIDNAELRAITSSSLRRNQDRVLFSDPNTKYFLNLQGIELTTWKKIHRAVLNAK